MMNSQQHLQTIYQLVHQLKEELQAHEEAVKEEGKQLKFCDEYQQDLLHIIESFATSGSESASIMSKLRQNRVRRRAIKDSQTINQKSAASLHQLKKAVHAFPTGLCNNPPTYILKTPEGLELVDTLDTERKRTHVTFHYLEPKNTEQKQKVAKEIDEEVSPSESSSIICSSPTATPIHLARNKNGWQLVENDETILFSNKKMQKIASYIIEEGLEVYADKLHIKQLTKLVEDQLQLH